MKQLMFATAVWLCIGLLAEPYARGKKAQHRPDAAVLDQESFLITGAIVDSKGLPVVGKRVFALQIDASGNVLRSFAVSKSRSLALTNPSGVSDGDGRFTVTVRRDYALEGQKGLRLIMLCLDPGVVDLGPQVVLVNVTKEGKDVDAQKITFSRPGSGTVLPDARTMPPGVKFKLNGRGVTTDRLAGALTLKLDSPMRLKVKGFAVEVASLIAELDGFLAWNNVATSARGGPVQWEAVLENGWVEGYRMLNTDLASLQGQEVSVPTPSGNVLPGRVEGDRILVVK